MRHESAEYEVRVLDLYLSSYPDVREVYELKEAMGRLYRSFEHYRLRLLKACA
jgi:hypothetical protein